MTPDRQRIIERLQTSDEPYRAIARDLGVSDWLVRKIARELDGDERPMRSQPSPPPSNPGSSAGWIVAAGVGVFVLLMWFGARWMPPESWD